MLNGFGQDGQIDTRTRLILAGELLFGERGVDAVPLSDVMALAGQRNASALGYHIGGREELLLAILDYRRAAVDERRVDLLQEFTSSGVEMDEYVIATCMIMPLVELMLSDPHGGNYLRFLSQIYVTERPESAYRATGQRDRGIRQCLALLKDRQSSVGARLVAERFMVSTRGAIYALADWQRDTAASRSGTPRTRLQAFVGDLIAMTAAGLAAENNGRVWPIRILPPAQKTERPAELAT